MDASAATIPTTDVLKRLNRLLSEITVIRKELEGFQQVRPVSASVVEWAERVNATINDPVYRKDRDRVIARIPAPLRHAVAVECYRLNKNVTLGWVAAIAGVLPLEAPDLLRAHGIEPETTANLGLTATDMDETLDDLLAKGVLAD